MSAITLLCLVWVLAALTMAWGWRWQLQRHNAGIVDVLWAAGLAGAAVLIALLAPGDVLHRTTVGALGAIWGWRLAAHLWRRVGSEAEDGRYRYLRAHWQGSQLKFFGFFQLQAGLMVLFSLPFLAAAWHAQGHLGWLIAGAGIWIVSVTGETVADRQLAAFRAIPSHRGKTCQRGLWRYSRHPNYFFEWLHWFAYVALAIGSPLAWLAWSGPVLMYVFLRWISGIPFTEAQALRSRGEEYRRYQQSTPMLFPWFPKHLPEKGFRT